MYTLLLLGSLSFLYQACTQTERHYIGDINQPVAVDSLGSNIWEGFELPYDAVIDKEYECFVRAVYIESYAEGIKGQQAVAQVLVNRSLSRQFPESFCDIIAQRQGRVYQFPWMGERNKRGLILEDNIIDEMTIYLASIYVGGYTVPKLEKANYFKRCDVKNDSWWSSLRMVAKIGDHCFYSNRGE
jgi:spore germination cell wall hydrolase CwlJ-like protein